MIRTMDEVMAKLMEYIPAPGLMHHNYKLDRMRQLMELLGNPQDSFKSIHIAGTSGKTSTAYFIRGLLQAAGAKTGLTVSPHIMSVTERVQINGEPIADEKFIKYLNELLQKVEASDIEPTYYELLVALAYVIFRAEKVEYAVVETGLGGLLDATNVITRLDKLCVITDIGLDHTEVLGDTIEEIAVQKAGIVQPGNQVVIQYQHSTIEAVLEKEALRRGATKIRYVDNDEPQSTELPKFQRHNWAVALTTYEVLAARNALQPIMDLNLRAAMRSQPPGRMEEFHVRGKMIIMDGAHNEQKMHALVQSLQEKGAGRLNVLVSFAANESGRIEGGLKELLPITNQLVVTDFSVIRDVGKAASSADEIERIAEKLGFASIKVITDPKEALDYALSSHESQLLITGSLYLVAQLRELILAV